MQAFLTKCELVIEKLGQMSKKKFTLVLFKTVKTLNATIMFKNK